MHSTGVWLGHVGEEDGLRVSEVNAMEYAGPLDGIGQFRTRAFRPRGSVLQDPYPRVSCLHLWRRHRWPAHLRGRRMRAGIAGDAHEARFRNTHNARVEIPPWLPSWAVR